jgi:hypothetical protein
MSKLLHTDMDRLIWSLFACSARTNTGGSATPGDAARHADALWQQLQERTETKQ